MGLAGASSKTNLTIFASVLFLFGLVLGFMSLRSMNYRRTDGKIIQSEVTGSGKSRKTTIRYLYTVNERNYDNDRVSYALNLMRENELLASYPVGKTVPVYYSITDPSYSVLEKGFSGGPLVLMAVGAGLFVAARRSS
jgi:hypothetical protein